MKAVRRGLGRSLLPWRASPPSPCRSQDSAVDAARSESATERAGAVRTVGVQVVRRSRRPLPGRDRSHRTRRDGGGGPRPPHLPDAFVASGPCALADRRPCDLSASASSSCAPLPWTKANRWMAASTSWTSPVPGGPAASCSLPPAQQSGPRPRSAVIELDDTSLGGGRSGLGGGRSGLGSGHHLPGRSITACFVLLDGSAPQAPQQPAAEPTGLRCDISSRSGTTPRFLAVRGHATGIPWLVPNV